RWLKITAAIEHRTTPYSRDNEEARCNPPIVDDARIHRQMLFQIAGRTITVLVEDRVNSKFGLSIPACELPSGALRYWAAINGKYIGRNIDGRAKTRINIPLPLC